MLPRWRALQLGGELDALGFAAGEFGGGLAEAQVAEADLAQHVQRALRAAARRRRIRTRRRPSCPSTSAMFLSR